MSAKILLEKRAILLQKIAFEVLSNPNVKLSNVENLIGDPSIFDKDMTYILSMLYSHNNLVSDSLQVIAYPSTILEHLRDSLESRGFKLPSFRRRFDWIKTRSGGSFRNPSPEPGGEIQALDKPLRRIVEKLYELRIHDSSHVLDNTRRVVTKNTGAELVQLAETLIANIKRLTTEEMNYEVGDNDVRLTSGRTPEMDKRYDEVAASINSSTKTSSQGPRVELLHVTSPILSDDKWYCVSEGNIKGLKYALSLTHKDWVLNLSQESENVRYEYPDDLLGELPPYRVNVTFSSLVSVDEVEAVLDQIEDESFQYFWAPKKEGERIALQCTDVKALESGITQLTKLGGTAGLIQGLKGAEQIDESRKELFRVGGVQGSTGDTVIRLLRLPFAPDEIDDKWPAAELKEEKFVSKFVSSMTLELILKSRFSGFVEFDDKYRMIILWANSPGDDVKDENGATFRDHLVSILSSTKSKLAGIMGQTPEVMKTKTGAAFYFPKPSSLVRVIRSRDDLEAAILRIDYLLKDKENETSLSRNFNRSIDDDELPSPLEEPS